MLGKPLLVCAGIEGEALSLSLLMVFFIGRGFATWVSRKLEGPTQSLRFAVGTDSRISSLAMRCSFEAGVASKGCSVANCGLATTPAMFFSCVATGHMYDGGVMITASHLPFNRNGLKFFTRHGGAHLVAPRPESAVPATAVRTPAPTSTDPFPAPATAVRTSSPLVLSLQCPPQRCAPQRRRRPCRCAPPTAVSTAPVSTPSGARYGSAQCAPPRPRPCLLSYNKRI